MSDDLISRSALLERLAFKRDHNRLYQKSTYPGLESAISQVKKVPAVDAVPVVHGRWIPFKSEAAGNIQYCSACGIGNPNKTKYCPNCGAIMDGDGKI